MIDIPHQLRNACEDVRRKDFPLADLIPTMQLAADTIDSLREQLNEQAATLGRYRGNVTELREQFETYRAAVRRSGFIRDSGDGHA